MDKKIIACFLFISIMLCFGIVGCEKVSEEGTRGKDQDYTVVPTADMPEDFLREIEEKKINTFQMTYEDGEYLYLAVGYGEQEHGGFHITVQGFYELGEELCLETSLGGPEAEEVVSDKPSCPYLVIKTQKADREVRFKV